MFRQHLKLILNKRISKNVVLPAGFKSKIQTRYFHSLLNWTIILQGGEGLLVTSICFKSCSSGFMQQMTTGSTLVSLSIKILSDFGTGINCTWCCVFHLSQVKLDPVTVCKLQFNYGVILFTKLTSNVGFRMLTCQRNI